MMPDVLQPALSWIKENPIVAQAALTLFGNGVAIWLALFQQRSITRRELRLRGLQAKAISIALGADLIELTTLIAAMRMILQQKMDGQYAHLGEENLMAMTMLKAPESMMRRLDQVHIIGPSITRLLLVVLLRISEYNACATAESRFAASEKFSPHLRNLDKALMASRLDDFPA